MLQRDGGGKRPVNPGLSARTPDRARAMGMKPSATVDALLAAGVERPHWARWNEDDKEAMAASNARIQRAGLFSDRGRAFMRPESEQEGQDGQDAA